MKKQEDLRNNANVLNVKLDNYIKANADKIQRHIATYVGKCFYEDDISIVKYFKITNINFLSTTDIDVTILYIDNDTNGNFNCETICSTYNNINKLLSDLDRMYSISEDNFNQAYISYTKSQFKKLGISYDIPD
jgi:hypothetical protein